ncbi:MAG: CPBP family glutamic-type intramembrane protease, partial [Sporosarcina sp.]
MKRGLMLSIISIVFLLWIEQSLEVAYIWKTAAKAIFFLIIPVILFWKSGFPFLRLRNADQESIKIAIGSGIAIMGIIVAVFVVLQPFIDIDALIVDLSAAGVTTITFPFIALYILFGNSILEEFFFRGLLPNLIGKSPFRVVLPSFLFAIYHISIFLPWFSPILLALA